MNTIKDEWEDFSRIVLGKTFESELDFVLAEKLFFSGALSVFMILKRITKGEISQEAFVKIFESLRLEAINHVTDFIRPDRSDNATETNSRSREV